LGKKAGPAARSAVKEVGAITLATTKSMAPVAPPGLEGEPPGLLAATFDMRVSAKGGAANAHATIGPLSKTTYPRVIGRAWRSTKKGARHLADLHRKVITVARYLEFGTSKMAANPFMRTAFHSSVDAAYDKIKETLWNNLQRAIKKAAKNG
jgi:HK97 gp10 family phage protein